MLKMRASTFFRASTLAVIFFAATFFLTMFWVGSTLMESRQSYTSYQALKSVVSINLNRTMSRYLLSGDASLLAEADKILDQIIEQARSLPSQELQVSVSQSAKQLKDDLNNKYRALGKLSGDPFALLRNNEQSLAALSHQLARYAQQSDQLSAEQKFVFVITSEEFASGLINLSNAREKAFSSKPIAKDSMLFALNEIKQSGDKLLAFPLLGIFAEAADEDDFDFDDDEEAEDLSEEARDELSSYLSRYQSEMENTINQQQQRNTGLDTLAAQVDALEQKILGGEAQVMTSQEQVNDQLQIIVIALLAFLLLFLFFNHLLQHRIILKPLRTLRDSFVQLVTDGKVDNIVGINNKTEFGEISKSFNKLVSQLALEDEQKAQQLGMVAKALTTMESQTQNILSSSSSTSQHIEGVSQIMTELRVLTDTVNELSERVYTNAKATHQAMDDSQNKVVEVLSASESTNQAAQSGKEAIESLSQSVDSVGSIVGVISAIAEQTNLLALNAAIEAARAGEQGRGFSVVADEVRQLAGKTQDSLNQVTSNLSELQQASGALETSIFDIEQASNKQQGIAQLLKENADSVVEQAISSANVAQDTLLHIQQQRTQFSAFETAMENVNSEVSGSRELAETISSDVSGQVSNISQTLKLA